MTDDGYEYIINKIRAIYETDPVAAQFLREDGEGGMSSGIYRMAREIERLRLKCGEPNHRPEGWEDDEDDRNDAEADQLIYKMRGGKVA